MSSIDICLVGLSCVVVVQIFGGFVFDASRRLTARCTLPCSPTYINNHVKHTLEHWHTYTHTHTSAYERTVIHTETHIRRQIQSRYMYRSSCPSIINFTQNTSNYDCIHAYQCNPIAICSHKVCVEMPQSSECWMVRRMKERSIVRTLPKTTMCIRYTIIFSYIFFRFRHSLGASNTECPIIHPYSISAIS